MAMTAPHATVVVIGGPTAGGKSQLALDLACILNGVVINGDAVQLYQGAPILSAQPDAADMNTAPHRLYGCLAPDVTATAVQWRAMAITDINAAHAAGRVPIVVGGTGLYLSALTKGLSPVPDIPPTVRAEVRDMADTLPSSDLHARLAALDSGSAAIIHPNHTSRIARALEVVMATGRSILAWQAMPPDNTDTRGYRFVDVRLLPPRDKVYARCDTRVDAMIAKGLYDEVRALRAAGLNDSMPVMKTIGLVDVCTFLDGHVSESDMKSSICMQTRRYAKRQYTWFAHQGQADMVLHGGADDMIRARKMIENG